MLADHSVIIPSRLSKPIRHVREAEDGLNRHKALIDLGESLLQYLVGILLGEYRRQAVADEVMETEFYRFSSRKLSMGSYQSFLRLLSKHFQGSILGARLNDRKLYPAIGTLELEFALLRQVVDEGADQGFAVLMEPLRHGRNPGLKSLPEFFDTLVMIRNIWAHPEDKAGKEVKRKWPLVDEYFRMINDPLEQVLSDVLSDLTGILTAHPSAQVVRIDERNNRLHYVLDMGDHPQEKEQDYPSDAGIPLTTNLTYLLDDREKFFIQLYYGKIPSVSADIVQRIMAVEKARERTPILLEMIREKLVASKQIDELELLVLRDTARTNYIDEKALFGLIEKVRSELGIAAETGTPEQPGSLFIPSRRLAAGDAIFNPMLLRYFMLVGRLNTDAAKRENAEYKETEKRIAQIRKDIRDLPVVARIDRKETEIRKVKTRKREALQKIRERIRQCKDDIREATDDQRKLRHRERMAGLEQELSEKDQSFTAEIDALELELGELNQKRIADASQREQEALKLEGQNEVLYNHSIWGNHQDIWRECSRFAVQLTDRNLNRGGGESVRWITRDNAWQQGALTHYYWGRIYPEKAPLNQIIHIGLSIRNGFSWWPGNVQESVREMLSGPAVLICTAFHERDLFRLGLDKPLLNAMYIQDLVDQYEQELQDLGVLVVAQPKDKSSEWYWEVSELVAMEKYLEAKDQFIVRGIFSRPWRLQDFLTDGVADPVRIGEFEAKVSALLTLFSNAIVMANDWALTQGINEEDLERREDHFLRYREEFHVRFDQARTSAGNVNFTEEQILSWREASEQEFGLNQRVLDQVLAKYKAGFKGEKSQE